MRAVYVSGGSVSVRELPDPEPGPGEVLVSPRLVGICGTDLELLRGYRGFSGVPGHEFVGTPLSGRLEGERVVAEINVGCGECRYCRAGVREHCLNRQVIGITRDGAMAELVAVPEGNLHRVPDSVSDEEAVFTEPLAAALRVLETAHVKPRHEVVVLGAGRLGQLVARVLALTGCRLTVVDRAEWKLRLLEGLADDLRTSAEGLEADLVVECTGRPELLEEAVRIARPMGVVVLKTTSVEPYRVSSALVVDEVSVLGSRCGPFEAALRLLERGLVDVRPLISAVYPLEEAPRAFEEAERSLKVLIRVG
ncbi:MAG: alcohol dehydrogenase [Thermoproteota archaeon]|nr:MAG: alcohol dehydrogenase [Candidatus Korarchaeota archaeon]